jgi:hypothetical protein
VDIDDIRAARAIGHVVKHTPSTSSAALGEPGGGSWC